MIDLELPPYRPYTRLLTALRGSDELFGRVAFSEATTTERGIYDVNERERERLAHVLLLQGRPADVGLVRRLLDHEITARERDSFQGAGDTLTILSSLLLEWSPPAPSDTLLFWRAKRANFDTFAGGYDIEFVFAQLEPDAVRRTVAEHSTSDAVKALEKYDAEAIVDGLAQWRVSLAARYPRSAESLDAVDAEAWAELFDDLEGLERFGLVNAGTPDARARLYERLERHDVAAREWRAAADGMESPWDRASRLRSALASAARVPMAMPAAADALDALRSQIPSWNTVGLGPMSTQACYELAAALDDEEGARLWRMAERWRSELNDLSLVGWRAALAAARKWGSPEDVAAHEAAVLAEHRRIYGDTPLEL